MASILNGGRYLAVYTASVGTTPSIGATPVYTCTAQIKTTVTNRSAEPHDIDIEQIQDDGSLYAFLETYKPTAATANAEDVTYEDGVKVSAASVEKPLLIIVKGGNVPGGGNKIYSAIAQLDPESGSWSQEASKYSRPSLKFKSVDPGGVVTVPTTYYTGVAVTPAQVTFGLGSIKYGRVTFA